MITKRLDKKIHRVIYFLILLLLPIFCECSINFNIDASVDKAVIKFGESLTLTITITLEISGGIAPQISPPSISEIPGFDIIGRSSSHKVSFVNNRGLLQIQTFLELVPQKSGDITIPSLTIIGPDGKSYTTNPIKLKVLTPSESDDDDNNTTTSKSSADSNFEVSSQNNYKNTSFSILKLVAIFLGIIGLLISAPILLSWYLNRNYKKTSKWDEIFEHDESTKNNNQSKETYNFAQNTNKDTQNLSSSSSTEFISLKQLDSYFNKLLSELLYKNHEPTLELYKSIFDLFKECMIKAYPNDIKLNMTPNEIIQQLKIKLGDNFHMLLDNILSSWEETCFANKLPSRSWTVISDDIKSVIHTISKKYYK